MNRKITWSMIQKEKKRKEKREKIKKVLRVVGYWIGLSLLGLIIFPFLYAMLYLFLLVV